MKKTDDYDLYDKDFNEFIRRGIESFDLEYHPGGHVERGRGKTNEK